VKLSKNGVQFCTSSPVCSEFESNFRKTSKGKASKHPTHSNSNTTHVMASSQPVAKQQQQLQRLQIQQLVQRRTLWESYLHSLETRPLYTKALTSGVLNAAEEFCAQLLGILAKINSRSQSGGSSCFVFVVACSFEALNVCCDLITQTLSISIFCDTIDPFISIHLSSQATLFREQRR